jgi:fructoselysine-6-P-deglycase FrlB-like protein
LNVVSAVRATLAHRLPPLSPLMHVHETGLPGVATYLRRRLGTTIPDTARLHVAISGAPSADLAARLRTARHDGCICIGIVTHNDDPIIQTCDHVILLAAAPGIATTLAAFAAAELVVCAATGRLPPAHLPERLAFAEQLDWSPLAHHLDAGLTFLGRGPARGTAEAAVSMVSHPAAEPGAILAFLQQDDTRPKTETWLNDLRAQGRIVLAPWAELPAPPPQDPASDLLAQLYAFSLALPAPAEPPATVPSPPDQCRDHSG